MGKQYAFDLTSGNLVYRIPGMRHGDGQVDSDENPVWLLADLATYNATYDAMVAATRNATHG